MTAQIINSNPILKLVNTYRPNIIEELKNLLFKNLLLNQNQISIFKFPYGLKMNFLVTRLIFERKMEQMVRERVIIRSKAETGANNYLLYNNQLTLQSLKRIVNMSLKSLGFSKGMQNLLLNMVDKPLESEFKRFDRDNDGKVDSEEFSQGFVNFYL